MFVTNRRFNTREENYEGEKMDVEESRWAHENEIDFVITDSKSII